MHVHLDLVGGLAGDMFLAAAIDAGLVDLDDLTAVLRSVGLGDVSVVATESCRGAITGTHVRFEGWDPSQDADHRHLSTIREMLHEAGLDGGLERHAQSMFTALGQAESKIHGIPLDRVHFHEVGAVDSILDFVAAAYVIARSDATWSCSAVPVGRGTIHTAHGEIPVPAPAAAELLRGMPLSPKDVEAELVTPTGAAILHELSPSFRSVGGQLDGVGYGLGTRDLAELSNVARMMVFDRGATEVESVLKLECEIDDMTAEHLAAAEGALFAAGALDVVRTSVQMKKGRLGCRLTVLAPQSAREAVTSAVFLHTTTFGLRIAIVQRITLERDWVDVDTRFGMVRVKVGRRGDEVVQQSPEFEDCLRCAAEHGVPVETVHRAALAAIDLT